MVKKDDFNADSEFLAQLVLSIKTAFSSLKSYSEVKFYDNTDMKRLFHISDSTLYRMRKNSLIPFQKIGGKFYYPSALVNQYFKGITRP